MPSLPQDVLALQRQGLQLIGGKLLRLTPADAQGKKGLWKTVAYLYRTYEEGYGKISFSAFKFDRMARQ